jgi:hypothetical protein
MWEDPIVRDVHRTREKLAAEYGFDVKAIFADLRKRQASLGGRLIPQKNTVITAVELNQDGQFSPPDSTPTGTPPAAEV